MSRNDITLEGTEMEELTAEGSVRVLNNSTIIYNAEIEPALVDDFMQILSIMLHQTRTAKVELTGYSPRINVLFSTHGGAIYDAFRMYDAIHSSDIPIDVYATGLVASSGLLVLLAGATRNAYPHTSFLFHGISGGMQGTHEQLRGYYKHTEQLAAYMTRLFVENTKLTLVEIEDMSREEHWFDTQKAMEYGFIENIQKTPKL